MNGKDENIETFMAQLEVENDQRNASVGTMMKEETQANMDDELNNLYEMMNYLGLHKEHN
jgi:ribosome assembly protein YihI (activator of Der GTPase)